MFAAFERLQPKLVGALLDAVATAFSPAAHAQSKQLPRMADFALWASAAETAFGWEPGTFLRSYQGNRESANEVALEASAIARPLLELLEEQGSWSGTSSELLTVLDPKVNDQLKRQKSWPKNGRSISGHLKRLAPNIRSAGWDIYFYREAKQRLVSIQRFDRHPAAATKRCNSMRIVVIRHLLTQMTVMTQSPKDPDGKRDNYDHR